MYLAARLNELNDPVLARKVGKQITTLQERVAELYRSNVVGTLTAHTIGFLVTILRGDVKRAHDEMIRARCDKLAINLMANVMMGELKRLSRQVMEARHSEQHRQRVLGRPTQFFDPSEKRPQRIFTAEENVVVAEYVNGQARGARIRIDQMSDPITPEVLIKRSRAKLARRGKPSDFY